MTSSLLAYDATLGVIATLDQMVAYDPSGAVLGLIDFEAHEDAGGEATDIWLVSGAIGSKTWPEQLGGQAHNFRVELAGPAGRKRILALVHRTSGIRRERAAVLARIAAGATAGPILAADGADAPPGSGSPPGLPLIGGSHA